MKGGQPEEEISIIFKKPEESGHSTFTILKEE
jgi:hypothetical protein